VTKKEISDGGLSIMDAVFHALKSSSPAARIDRLRGHEAQITNDNKLAQRMGATWLPKADELAKWYEEAGHVAPPALLAAISEAEKVVALPYVNRDKERQAGTKKERRPDVTEWISDQLRRNPTAKASDLWSRAPDWLTDQLGLDRFRKRLSAAKKMGASK